MYWEIISFSTPLPDREGSRGIAAEVHEKADDILRPNFELKTGLGEVGFRLKICKPGHDLISAIET